MPRLLLTMAVFVLGSSLGAQSTVSLMTPKDAWSFNNGQEFPGATGSLSLDSDAKKGDILKLVGDFSKGGGYVQAGRKITNLDIRDLSFGIRLTDGVGVTIRLNDATNQTHQINLKLEPNADWQQIVLPLERFFARRGQADAVTMVTKYEFWGGAKDGQWHGPATGLYILIGNEERKNLVRTAWISDIVVTPRPKPVTEIQTTIRLDEIIEGEHDWRFSLGEEFKGAKGSLQVVKDEPAPDQACFKLVGDFTNGGAYVAAIKNLGDLNVNDVREFRLRVKSSHAKFIGVQIVDGSGQTHQQARFPINADGAWHEITIDPKKIAGGEHWGGANDAKWHAPPKQLALSLSSQADEKKQPVVYLAEIRAEARQSLFMQAASFQFDFEKLDKLSDAWTTEGTVTIDAKSAFQGSRSLRLTRPLQAGEPACSASGPSFSASPGLWKISLACKAELASPDDSYHGVVLLECFDGQGKIVERIPLAEMFGKRDWQSIGKSVELPQVVRTVRFRAQINKAHGDFWIDDLTAAPLASAGPRDDRINRLLFATSQLGNLLFPQDSRKVDLTLEANKPLRENQQRVSCVVRDYWGAEQTKPMIVQLKRGDKKNGRIQYHGSLDLSDSALEIGRYYEVHAEITQEGSEPFRYFTSLAILPEAGTKRYKPEEIPFTSRNWDNRFTEYFLLSDRLGLRTCGIWGGWSAQPPYRPEAPNIEMCQKLHMGVLTGTPIPTIELGKKEYDEQALRQGVRNWIEKYGQHRPLTISLGNEPHGTGERVHANVAAYRAVYEEIKKVDPSIFVVATAVEPNEEYFKLGYGNFCDAYDFHVYEGSKNVREAIGQYRTLMQKYGPVRPIWSTELGLNSQGLPRYRVAVELVQSFTSFFAAGGESASWFGLLYPDGDAKSFGSSGDSHNVFDCRYNRYAPRLDALAYYNMVNAIANKKFQEEQNYPTDLHAFLFRDKEQRHLQVLWKDKDRQDVFIPLPGVQQVQVIRIDGSRIALDADGKGITLSISADPVLLLYDGDHVPLAKTLTPPAGTLQAASTMPRGSSATLSITGAGEYKLAVSVPTFWSMTKDTADRITATPPRTSTIREAQFGITLIDAQGKRRGELSHRATILD